MSCFPALKLLLGSFAQHVFFGVIMALWQELRGQGVVSKVKVFWLLPPDNHVYSTPGPIGRSDIGI